MKEIPRWRRGTVRDGKYEIENHRFVTDIMDPLQHARLLNGFPKERFNQEVVKKITVEASKGKRCG